MNFFKSTLILATILVFTLSEAAAQTKISYGPHVGAGISTMRLDKIYTAIGYRAGMRVKLKIIEGIYFSPDLGYALKGSDDLNKEFETDFVYGGHQIYPELRFGYADLYLPIEIGMGNRMYFITGMQLGYLIRMNGTFNLDQYELYNLRKTDTGILAGLNINTKTGLGFSFILNHGITRIQESTNGIKINFLTTIGAYYMFKPKKKNQGVPAVPAM